MMMWGMRVPVVIAGALALACVGLTAFILATDKPPPKRIEQFVPPVAGSEVPTSEAVPCELVEMKDFSSPDRRRARAFIAVPGGVNSLTADQRAQTALKAAVEIRTVKGADYVVVQMAFDAEAMSAGWVAEAEYAPDGFDQTGKHRLRNKTWQAKVSTRSPTEDEISIIRTWDKHADSFRDAQGLIDEKKLKAKIEKESGFSLETITAGEASRSRKNWSMTTIVSATRADSRLSCRNSNQVNVADPPRIA
jgi:hypothetical protein